MTAVLVLAGAACGGRSELDAPVSGDAASEPIAYTSANVDGLNSLSAIAADERDVVYWIAGGDVVRHDASSTTVLAHFDGDGATALAVDGTRVVYTLASGVLNAVPRDGGASVTRASGLPRSPLLISPRADGSFLVIGNDASHAGRVTSVDTNGVVNDVWSSVGSLESAAVDETFVYAAVGTSGGVVIVRIEVASGGATVLVDGFQWVPALAADGSRLYAFNVNFNAPNAGKWSNGLLTMPKSGGVPTPFFDPPEPYFYASIAVDASGVYLTTAFEGETFPSVIGELWRLAPDGHGTSLAGDFGAPANVPYLAFGPVCLSPNAVHWIVSARGADGVHELCK